MLLMIIVCCNMSVWGSQWSMWERMVSGPPSVSMASCLTSADMSWVTNGWTRPQFVPLLSSVSTQAVRIYGNTVYTVSWHQPHGCSAILCSPLAGPGCIKNVVNPIYLQMRLIQYRRLISLWPSLASLSLAFINNIMLVTLTPDHSLLGFRKCKLDIPILYDISLVLPMINYQLRHTS